MVRILAISGSLRRTSINTMLLHAAAELAPPDTEIVLSDIIGKLPLFNPDLEGSEPVSVHEFRESIRAAGAVLISSPEYAHGITGVIKNALDWIVGSGELSSGKPVAVLNASYSSQFADAQLKEVLRTMDAHLVDEASISIPLQGKRLDTNGIVSDTNLKTLLQSAINSLLNQVRQDQYYSVSHSLPAAEM